MFPILVQGASVPEILSDVVATISFAEYEHIEVETSVAVEDGVFPFNRGSRMWPPSLFINLLLSYYIGVRSLLDATKMNAF